MTTNKPIEAGRLTFATELDPDGDLEVDIECDCYISTYIADADLIKLRDHLNTLLEGK